MIGGMGGSHPLIQFYALNFFRHGKGKAAHPCEELVDPS